MAADANSHDDALAAALDSYLAELQTGRMPDRASFLARHPELAAMLDCLDQLEQLAPPSSAQAGTVNPSAESPMPRQPEGGAVIDFDRYELLEEIEDTLT